MKLIRLSTVLLIIPLLLILWHISANPAYAVSAYVHGLVYMYPNYNCNDANVGSAPRYFFGSGCSAVGSSVCYGPNDQTQDPAIYMVNDTTTLTAFPRSCTSSNRPMWDFGLTTVNQNIALAIDNSRYTRAITSQVAQHGFKMTNWSRFVTDTNNSRCYNIDWNGTGTAPANYDFEEHLFYSGSNVISSTSVSTGAIPLLSYSVPTAGGGTKVCNQNNFFFFNDYGYPSFSTTGPHIGVPGEQMNFAVNASAPSSPQTNRQLAYNGDIYVTTDSATAPSNCPANKVQTNVDGTAYCSLTTVALSGNSAQMTANWTPPAVGTYYLANDVIDSNDQRCANNPFCNLQGANSCAAGAHCVDCPTWATQFAGPYSKSWEGPCSQTFRIDIVAPTPVPPSITSLTITNNKTTGTFSSTANASGRQNAESGYNWFNPMTISVQTGGTPTATYVAFYDKTGISTPYSSIISSGNPSTSLANLLSGDPKKGFILKYTSSGAYQVWDPVTLGGSWQNISPQFGYDICGNDTDNRRDCTNHRYYTIFKESSANTWIVNTYQVTLSRLMYTAVYAVDSNNPSTTPAFNANITPTVVSKP